MAHSKLPIHRVKTAVFDGKRFRILWRKRKMPVKEARRAKREGIIEWGRAHLEPPYRTLYFSMDPELHPTPEDLFSTIVHESAHASFPQLDEESVLAHEVALTKFLKRVGFKITLA